MATNFNAASIGELPGINGMRDDGRAPSRFAKVGSGDSTDSGRRIDEYCSCVDDELRTSEKRYPLVGLVFLALASLLAMGLVGALLNLVLWGH
jgi:hypothetical protein